MTSKQIKAVFYTLDNDKSGNISDQEWSEFYGEFVKPFLECDTDSDSKLNEQEVT